MLEPPVRHQSYRSGSPVCDFSFPLSPLLSIQPVNANMAIQSSQYPSPLSLVPFQSASVGATDVTVYSVFNKLYLTATALVLCRGPPLLPYLPGPCIQPSFMS